MNLVTAEKGNGFAASGKSKESKARKLQLIVCRNNIYVFVRDFCTFQRPEMVRLEGENIELMRSGVGNANSVADGEEVAAKERGDRGGTPS
jgi:hypothetical protein